MKVVALIPYFGGTSTATHSREDTRRGYLRETLESLRPAGFEPHIGVCRDEGVDGVLIDSRPEWLPAMFFKWAQANVEADLIYCTEADQILHLASELLGFPDDYRYLVPHRVNDGGVFPNGLPPHGAPWVYKPYGVSNAFGGAFLCTQELFRKVDFTLADKYPVEHATGFDIYYTGACFKTMDTTKFWVEHLSSQEHR